MEIRPYKRRANYYETDQMGVIHHSNYIRWFEETRVDFMEQIGFGYEKSMEAGIDFAVLGISCNYHSMVRFGDTVLIESAIYALSPARMSIRYSIKDAETGELRTTGETHHCYYRTKQQRPVSLKKALPDLYALFESVCEKDEE